MSDFGRKVEEHRERLGMNQKALAERVGLSPSHLNRIEKGTRKSPQVEAVLQMIDVLRLTRAEAEEFVQLAGYSPMVLETEGLVYNAPTLQPSLTRLQQALSLYPLDVQQQYINTFITILELANQEESVEEPKRNDNGE